MTPEACGAKADGVKVVGAGYSIGQNVPAQMPEGERSETSLDYV